MNWFDTTGLTSLAKNALKEAQRTIDKALDIQDEDGQEEVPSGSSPPPPPADKSDFFASWGLTVSGEGDEPVDTAPRPVVTESPSKAGAHSLWGSFAGSFFEHGDADTKPVSKQPDSTNTAQNTDYSFSENHLLLSNYNEDQKEIKKEEMATVDRRDSSRSNRLSLVSSRNSSDSVEVLSHSTKTTPDSEAVSVHSISHSSSGRLKANSESVEILPDSLMSPSSVECLGFDSQYSNSTSSNISLTDLSGKKSTCSDRTEQADARTGDSVSLVADDDEDTMSYNSVSECTAPTVLDTEDKFSVGPNFRNVRHIELQKKLGEKDLIQIDHVLHQKMQLSENSSNDGSWSDRTLNADNDSVILDTSAESKTKESSETETEDVTVVDKLSDSSSFYNVDVPSNILQLLENSTFVNVEKQQCMAESSDSSQKDCSIKERTSPTSSESKSDLVKIGSDRTSGHTSGDELETATSSDIEIIPSPNSENHSYCRSSPAKYRHKDDNMSPSLVDLVLGKSLVTKIKGHNRELSEASVQSNTSDESHGSENDRLMRRLCEMAEILEARETKLTEVSRSNAELMEHNEDLKMQVQSLLVKHEGTDIINEDYTQRMSALEKKFQQAIREKDQLRKQCDALKGESGRKSWQEQESALRERDDMIAQLQEEGEKLAHQQLHHSNIIKKLRAKERDQEQLLKTLRDKISEQTSELDRLKRAISAKEELEVNQIEAVYKLTTTNKRLESELNEAKSALDDARHKLGTSRTSLEGARTELLELQRRAGELERRAGNGEQAVRELQRAKGDADTARELLQQTRVDKAAEEKRWIARTEALRRELNAARELATSLEAGAGACVGAGANSGAGSLLGQLAALQEGAARRERAHAAHTQRLGSQLAETEVSLAKAIERERLARDEVVQVRALLDDAADQVRLLTAERDECRRAEQQALTKQSELEIACRSSTARADQLARSLASAQQALSEERAALEAEKKRAGLLQDQLSSREELSPSQSLASDSLSVSLWPQEEGSESGLVCAGVPGGTGGPVGVCGVEQLTAALSRREGELRALTDTLDKLRSEKRALGDHVARLQDNLDQYQGVQAQHDALLQMYGEKEEQLSELRLDLHDVTQLYKQQLDELVALKRARDTH